MIIRNWQYYEKEKEIGALGISKGQFMTGNLLGIIAEKKPMICEDNNLLNAKSFPFPVRMKLVDIFDGTNYAEIADEILEQLRILECEGCRAVITSGGNMGLFDCELHYTDMMVLSTPLAMLDFIITGISSSAKIAIINELTVKENLAVLKTLGFEKDVVKRCVFSDLEMNTYWNMYEAKIEVDEDWKIGACIWDSKENYHRYLKTCSIPVYDTLKLAGLLKNSIAQIPYEGVI